MAMPRVPMPDHARDRIRCGRRVVRRGDQEEAMRLTIDLPKTDDRPGGIHRRDVLQHPARGVNEGLEVYGIALAPEDPMGDEPWAHRAPIADDHAFRTDPHRLIV